MERLKYQFRLDVRIENQPPLKIDVIDSITVGLDPRNDLVLVGKKIKNHHFVFEKKEENLALRYLGNTNQSFLNNLPLEEGRTYILEPGDSLTLTGVEIIVLNELINIHHTQHIKKVLFDQAPLSTIDSIKATTSYVDHPIKAVKKEVHPRSAHAPKIETKEITPANKGSLLSLWLVKFYAMITDAFITYALLVSVLPLVYANKYALGFLNFVSEFISPGRPNSFVSFFIAWYLLSFIQTMILGTTLGQIILGLRFNPNAGFFKLIVFRFKTFLYSIFMLPAQTRVLDTFFFKAIRKAGVIFVFIFILISPFLLPAPYNTPVHLVSGKTNSLKQDLRSRSIYAHSQAMKLTLQTELSFRYYFQPIFANSNKRAFQLIDLEAQKNVIVKEDTSYSYAELEERLFYANPLYSLLHPTPLKDLSIKNKKELFQSVLLLSPIQLKTTAAAFGPFFGSAILLKEELLGGNPATNTTIKTYAPENPLIFVSTPEQDFFYLFEDQRVIRFVIDSNKRGPLTAVLEDDIFTKFLVENEAMQATTGNSQDFLLTQDKFLQGDEQSLLTYYIQEAKSLSNVKIIHANMDLTENAKLALIRNIEVVQQFIKDRNIYKSFNDIKNQLTPMEKPGEKR